jgi:DHA2 family multidrug resistance protein
MGTSVATTVWEARASLHHAHLTEGLLEGQGAFGQVLQRMIESGFSREQALLQINRMIDQQAFTRAADDVFFASSLIFLALISMIWLTRRPAPKKMAQNAPDASGAH